jgi:elongator complex protein 6
VDGLTGLYSSPPTTQNDSTAPARGINLAGASRTIPGRGPAGRAPLAPPARVPTNSSTTASSNNGSTPKQLHASGQGGVALDGLERDILSVISSIRSTDGDDDTLLILDQPDLVLAATPGISAVDMSGWITGLQQVRGTSILRLKSTG